MVMFDGIMDAELYVRILKEALLPSASRLYPRNSYLFMQDNDPKPTSRRACEFFADNRIEWWKPQLSLPISIPSRTYGMNLKNTFVGK